MRAIITYLNFDGNTRNAMTFYHRCLGGELLTNLVTIVNLSLCQRNRRW